jgi:hypothetical protein
MTEDPKTEEMRIVQAGRADDERRRADEAEEPEAVRAHERRADKAAYLREKLDEQAESQKP